MSTASPCFKAGDGPPRSDKLFTLPLDDKITWSKASIMRFYVENGGNVAVSYSGGKDSTVALHLARSIYPEMPAFFFDTGVEFPEVRAFVKNTPNVEFIKPGKSFRKIIAETGYPVVSKEVSKVVQYARDGHQWAIDRMNLDDDEHRYGYLKWKFLLDAPFKISPDCCYYLRKSLSYKCSREHGNRGTILGTRATESRLRMDVWKKNGEKSEEHNSLAPLSIWTDKDVAEYLRRYDLAIPAVYNMGYVRTGCMYCMFGIMSDPNKFLLLKKTHPKYWAYAMKPYDQGGLGMREVCDYLGIPSGCEQTNLLSFVEVERDD